MNPLPPAADGAASVPAADGAASVREVVPGIDRGPPSQRTSCPYFLGDPQRLIDLPGLLGLIDVARSPCGSGPVIPIAGTRPPGQAIHKKAPRELPGLIDVARSANGFGSVIHIASVIPIARTSLIKYLPAGVMRWWPAAADNQRQLPLPGPFGDPLFEIFAVYAHFPLIGQVLVFNGMATQIICQCKSVDAFYSKKAQWELEHPGSILGDFRMELPPTGPSSYISADSGVLLEVKIDATQDEDEELSNELLDWYNEPMSDKCNTISIKTSKGAVDVICAVINDAVEVSLRVWLCIPRELCSGRIHGSITAQTDIFDHDITIFTRGDKSGVNPLRRVAHPVPPFLCAESYRCVTLPLVRPFLAVPIHAARIEFKGTLTMEESKTLHVNQSILLNAEDILSQWVKHIDCYTSLSLSIRWAR